MKMLVVFVDMLRNNLVTGDSQIGKWFKKVGGTRFTECWTPMPDSAGSLGSFFTGTYPRKHKCTSRLKYPKHYLEGYNLFNLLEEKNFETIVHMNKNEIGVGMMPDFNGKVYEDFNEMFECLKKDTDQDLFAMVCLADYHWAMDDYRYRIKGNKIGQKRVLNILEKLEPTFELFDYVVVFSDHGCKLYHELKTQPKIKMIKMLDRDRSNVVMFVHKKGDTELKENNKLCSIMDFMPMVCSILGVEKDFDGIDLFSEQEHEFIAIEDSMDFAPKLSVSHDIWAVKTKVDLFSTTLYESTDSVECYKFFELLRRKTCSFKEMEKMKKILDKYGKLIKPEYKGVGYYTDGTKRHTSIKSMMRRSIK